MNFDVNAFLSCIVTAAVLNRIVNWTAVMNLVAIHAWLAALEVQLAGQPDKGTWRAERRGGETSWLNCESAALDRIGILSCRSKHQTQECRLSGGAVGGRNGGSAGLLHTAHSKQGDYPIANHESWTASVS